MTRTGLMWGVAAMVALIAAGPALAGDVLDRARERGSLRVAVLEGFPPLAMPQPDGTIDGFDAGVARALGERMGLKIDLVPVALSRVLDAQWGEDIDVAVTSLTPTPERRERLAFAAAYYRAPADFAVRLDDMTTLTPEMLSGKRLAAAEGTTQAAYLAHKLDLPGSGVPMPDYRVTPGEVILFPTLQDAFAAMAGEGDPTVDAVLADFPNLIGAQDDGLPIRVLGDPVFFEPMAIAVLPGDAELLEAIDAALVAARADGSLAALSVRWLGADLTGAPSQAD